MLKRLLPGARRRAAPPAAPAPRPAPEIVRLPHPDTPGAHGAPDIAVTLRRSARARRFVLTVGRADGVPRLTLPAAADREEALEFLARQADWLAEAMARSPRPARLRVGDALPVGGRDLVLTLAPPGRRMAPRIDDGRLIVPGPAEAAPGRARAWLKTAARSALAPAAERHAAALGRRPASITLRDTRSRWGSCTGAGALSFSWRLAMAPPEVLDYVAAHEAAHLVEMNHGPRFWALVARLRPDWRARRDWLTAHGAALQRVRFD